MASASGLREDHRAQARKRAVQAAILGYQHAKPLHYTQDRRRWNGISGRLIAAHGRYPQYADCSAFVTWCLWNGLHVPFNVRDVVNGQNWRAGFTGTMLRHGRTVRHRENMRQGDAVVYGRPGTTGAHTALYIGGGMVISHGSEGGPYRVPMDYRRDILSVRRYI